MHSPRVDQLFDGQDNAVNAAKQRLRSDTPLHEQDWLVLQRFGESGILAAGMRMGKSPKEIAALALQAPDEIPTPTTLPLLRTLTQTYDRVAPCSAQHAVDTFYQHNLHKKVSIPTRAKIAWLAQRAGKLDITRTRIDAVDTLETAMGDLEKRGHLDSAQLFAKNTLGVVKNAEGDAVYTRQYIDPTKNTAPASWLEATLTTALSNPTQSLPQALETTREAHARTNTDQHTILNSLEVALYEQTQPMDLRIAIQQMEVYGLPRALSRQHKGAYAAMRARVIGTGTYTTDTPLIAASDPALTPHLKNTERFLQDVAKNKPDHLKVMSTIAAGLMQGALHQERNRAAKALQRPTPTLNTQQER